ncbi:MAG: Hsp33 family molecular chaperone HslO [Clostridia bacterium]|nr:Hsp33 family molecular chaperone HslO [Clostridia bacterium]
MDAIYKTLIEDGYISLTVLETTKIVNTAIKLHNLTPLTAAGLGRTMTASLFMASTIKNKRDKIYVTISGDGVGGHVVVSADASLNVRGYIDNPSATLPLKENGKLDVKNLIGNGRLTVVKSMGLKEPYTGSSKIVSGEIAEDFAYYYTVSEQIPTAMALGVKVSKSGKCVGAGGVIMQVLPGCSLDKIERAEKIISNFNSVSSIIEEMGALNLCKEYFSEYSFDEYFPKYKCICSKKYIDGVVVSIGREEANSIIREQGKIEVICPYCSKKHVYDSEDVEKLFKK